MNPRYQKQKKNSYTKTSHFRKKKRKNMKQMKEVHRSEKHKMSNLRSIFFKEGNKIFVKFQNKHLLIKDWWLIW